MNILIYIGIYLIGCLITYLLVRKITLKYVDEEGKTDVWNSIKFSAKVMFITLFSWIATLSAIWLLLLLSLNKEQLNKLKEFFENITGENEQH